jgi:hypothetical protein
MKVGLVKYEKGFLVGVKYMETKWEKKLGDTMSFEGSVYKVDYIGTSRNDVIDYLNVLIRRQNKIIRNS